jgi:predicted negative regulator of RcsB-dependent stress response
VAKYKKKVARQLQHDKFRDTTMGLLDRLGDQLEGKGKTILYGLGGVALAAILVFVGVRWNNRKNDEAREALGRAITITTTPVSASGLSLPGNFTSDLERSQRAAEEFDKVAAKYGDPYRSQARYFAASNRLSFDKPKAIAELTELSKGSDKEVASLAKFALAQAKENGGSLDEAAQMYAELAKANDPTVSAESANLRLAKVYVKQGKKKEAADLLFNLVDASRKAKGTDQLPLPPSSAAREAATELQKLDPARYAQLTPETPLLG